MKYILADKRKAAAYGFSGPGYRTNGDLVCINEKDLAAAAVPSGSLQQRAEAVGGRIVSLGEAREALRPSNKFKS